MSNPKRTPPKSEAPVEQTAETNGPVANDAQAQSETTEELEAQLKLMQLEKEASKREAEDLRKMLDLMRNTVMAPKAAAVAPVTEIKIDPHYGQEKLLTSTSLGEIPAEDKWDEPRVFYKRGEGEIRNYAIRGRVIEHPYHQVVKFIELHSYIAGQGRSKQLIRQCYYQSWSKKETEWLQLHPLFGSMFTMYDPSTNDELDDISVGAQMRASDYINSISDLGTWIQLAAQYGISEHEPGWETKVRFAVFKNEVQKQKKKLEEGQKTKQTQLLAKLENARSRGVQVA